MHDQVNPDDIVHTLAEKLPEKLLQDIFPQSNPEDIRSALLSLVQKKSQQPQHKGKNQLSGTRPRQTGLPFSPTGKRT